MKLVFADTQYFVAIVGPNDESRERAIAVSEQLRREGLIIITSEMVMTELLNCFAERGAPLRQAAVKFVKQLQANPNVRIIPQTSIQFNDAMSFYESRNDKDWGLTDCASFKIMEEKGIREALTYDHHFEQAGFVALLRENL